MLVPVFIILFLTNWILEGRFDEKFSNVPLLPISLFAGLFVVYVFGMVFTQNTDAGWFDLQVKLSMLVFPVLLLTGTFGIRQYSTILLCFIAGNVFTSLICLGSSIYDYVLTNEVHFFYGAFSLFLHPGYSAMYIDLCIVILLLSFSHDGYIIPISSGGRVVFIIFFSCIVFLLSSKSGLIVLMLIYLIAILSFVLNSGKYFSGIFLLIVVVSGSYLLIRNVPEVGDRFRSIVKAFNETKIDKTSSESTSIRIVIWQKDIELIREHFLTGVGTGDVKDELLEKYKADGITGAYKMDLNVNKPISVLNAHSQFLQTFIAIGIFGFVLFMSGFVYPIINSIKRKNYLYLGFLVIVILNFATESMLETQAGVLFYAFFNSLLYKET